MTCLGFVLSTISKAFYDIISPSPHLDLENFSLTNRQLHSTELWVDAFTLLNVCNVQCRSTQCMVTKVSNLTTKSEQKEHQFFFSLFFDIESSFIALNWRVGEKHEISSQNKRLTKKKVVRNYSIITRRRSVEWNRSDLVASAACTSSPRERSLLWEPLEKGEREREQQNQIWERCCECTVRFTII